MKILVLNSGSSSIKFQLFDMDGEKSLSLGLVEAIGDKLGAIKVKCLKSGAVIENRVYIKDHDEGLSLIQQLLKKMDILKSFDILDGIGHRVVQGANLYSKPTLVTPKVLKDIEDISPLAPLHNYAHLKGIKTSLAQAPNVPEVVVFDTAYHQTIPQKAYMYAISYEMYEKYNIRKYGFHGSSHQYVVKTAANYLNIPLDQFNAISLHLGNGASSAAIKGGKSIDTSMGLTPLAGLVMGTRSGDIDPSVLDYICEKTGHDIKWVSNYLNKNCGLKGLCGSGDLRDVEDMIKQGDERAKLAFDIMIYRLKKYIGAYYAVLGKIDAIIFTGGIGENSSLVRSSVCKDMDHLGISIDEEVNEKRVDGIVQLNKKDMALKILKVPTDEELEIAKQTKEVIGNL